MTVRLLCSESSTSIKTFERVKTGNSGLLSAIERMLHVLTSGLTDDEIREVVLGALDEWLRKRR